jgi:hypothetical protein
MASDASKKLLERVTASKYGLLRSLTDKETLDASWLEGIDRAERLVRFLQKYLEERR